ncbi:hypothetical protein HC891_02745 [Candidatus Gracilibacteria bacterium]|nr:hypothetical protein [Candidatus Gracilibacteria bacterium]
MAGACASAHPSLCQPCCRGRCRPPAAQPGRSCVRPRLVLGSDECVVSSARRGRRCAAYHAGTGCKNLAALGADNDLLFFESFLTDLAGHGRLNSDLSHVLVAIDSFVYALARALRPHDSLLLTSDHGNIEDATTMSHTRNPVPLFVVGPAAPHFGAVHDLVGLKQALLAALVDQAHSI